MRDMSNAGPGNGGGTTTGYSVGFPVFTVPEWLGTKNLDFFQIDPVRQTTTEVWLGHSVSTEGHARMLLVATLMEPAGKRITIDDRRVSAAYEAAIKLAMLRLPAGDDRPAGFLRRLDDHVKAETASLDHWPVQTVSVDGAPVALRVWRFGGGIAATMDDPGAGPVCCLVSYGMELDGLELSVSGSLDDYGVPSVSALSRDQLPERAAMSVLPEPGGYHRDYHALLS
ncbi:hypothetical protein CFP71_01645 [Amycolatopsis thailandensis]|uniref:Uncharacterized protein n=2 Tax=Amycolatopsis thailandensis TaxID=589330 RepID=A0A229SIA2_9PSEU|nr:hypothetical protein CFP71_01645 [Amycolatopsis thailandensis]